ncbi:LytR cell envelope-related transcriptional attenuator [Motilibacter rhizosphaerae]|uniref:LytR cell envelope-related transcriptional attenuator n=1 Tax=Motilibacter rhizosphaerae TaxID=598652 RepID=A0A4Q7NSD6_9ACTN|nr:LytR C-terminal domain-containing protein [Motilibacter rhizosphaerae]RZS87570.1 LytR cell envelope-related transcriptional attenuator [Motilibacter rhizosphaerae]
MSGPDGPSPLGGLGAPRQGAHRGAAHPLRSALVSLVAVVAVVALLGGLYLAFGSPSGSGGGADSADDAAVSTSSSAAASPTPTPTAAAAAPTVGEPSPSSSDSGSASASPSDSATSGAAGDEAGSATPSATPSEGPGAGDEGGLKDLPVSVLNQSGRTGLAGRTASQLRSLGWTVSGVGNFHGKVPATTVYYPDGAFAAAQELAAELPGSQRIRPAFAGLSSSHLTLVLA